MVVPGAMDAVVRRASHGGRGVGPGYVDDADSCGTDFRSQSGLATVPSGVNHVTVAMPGVTASSMILATVQQAGGFYVKYAVPASGSFTIYINKAPAAPKTVAVAFIVLN